MPRARRASTAGLPQNFISQAGVWKFPSCNTFESQRYLKIFFEGILGIRNAYTLTTRANLSPYEYTNHNHLWIFLCSWQFDFHDRLFEIKKYSMMNLLLSSFSVTNLLDSLSLAIVLDFLGGVELTAFLAYGKFRRTFALFCSQKKV